MQRKTTDQLKQGDIVLHHGMYILLDRPPRSYGEGHGENTPYWAFSGLVLNADELCDRQSLSYDSYIACHLRGTWWRDAGGKPQTRDRWNVQGNHMATWQVTPPWREDGSLITDMGEYGGDIQVGAAPSRRFHHRLLPGRVFDVIAYPVQGDGATSRPAPDAPVRLQILYQMTVCKDVRDPGGTEVFADNTYPQLPERFDIDFVDISAAEKAARLLVQQFSPQHIDWDGAPHITLED